MGVRSKMLAIAAWRLLFFLPTVVGVDPNINNTLVPEGFASTVNIKLTYRNGPGKAGPVCGRLLDIPPSNTVIDLPTPDLEFKAAQVRTIPQVQFTGIIPGTLYTYLVVDQGMIDPKYGSHEKPFIQDLRVNVRDGDINTGLVLVDHHRVLPERRSTKAHVLLFRQSAELTDVNIKDYVNSACGYGFRCAFDAKTFAGNNSLTLVSAGGFVVLEDESSIATVVMFNPKLACHMLRRFIIRKNPLVGEAELTVGIAAKFKTEEVVTEPVCARVFHYMGDEVHVKWDSTGVVPARKIRTLPHVYLKLESDKSKGDNSTGDYPTGDKSKKADKPGNKTAEEKDHWFTLALVDQTVTPPRNSMERPFVHWLVSNIKNTDVSSGDCIVPYMSFLVSRGITNATFLLYKQSKHVEIDTSEYSDDTDCIFQFRCSWDMRRLAKDKGLEVVGALPFDIAADPFTVTKAVKGNRIDTQTGCQLLSAFRHEGRMLGECLPKFDAWKALKKELDECVVEFKKKMIMERMKNMCPELGEHFSEEMKKMDKKKGDEKKGDMQWYKKDKEMDDKRDMQWYEKDKEMDDKRDMMGEMKKEHMEMWIKKFLKEAMGKMEKMKEGKDGDVMKPDDDMEGPHCVQVVTKYMMMMKKKMMEGGDMKDDKMPDMEQGCKCLEAAKKFMKEQWEKFQEKKDGEKDWGKWRSWGDQGGKKDGEDEKAKFDKMMKEMWSKWEEKKENKDGWESKWENWEKKKKKDGWESKWENWEKEDEGADKLKKTMEEFKIKMMTEFMRKMKGENKEEGDDKKDLFEEMKKHIMKEFWTKLSKGGEKEKMEMMMEEMKMKIMKEFKEKMKKGEDGEKEWADKWERGKNWGKDEKKEEEGYKMKMMMMMMEKMKMMKEMMEKMMMGGEKMDKTDEEGKKIKMMMMMMMMEKIKMMKELIEKTNKGGEQIDKKGDGDKMKMMMMMMMMEKVKMMKEMMEKMKESCEKMDKKDDGHDMKAKMMMMLMMEKMKMMKEMMEKMKMGGEKMDNEEERGKMKMKMMMMMMKMKMMKEMMEKMKEGDKMGKEEEWSKMKMMMMMMMKMKMMKGMMEKMEGGDKMDKYGEEDKYEKVMKEIKMKMMKDKEEWGDKDMWGKMMEEMRKKWEEGDGEISGKEEKQKKMAFLVHAFKAFLMKHMAMKDKLDMVHEFMKKKMLLEKMCPEEEIMKGEDSKCGMMFKELMMKKKIMEMLKESFMDMKEEKDDMEKQKSYLFKKMVDGMMKKM